MKAPLHHALKVGQQVFAAQNQLVRDGEKRPLCTMCIVLFVFSSIFFVSSYLNLYAYRVGCCSIICTYTYNTYWLFRYVVLPRPANTADLPAVWSRPITTHFKLRALPHVRQNKFGWQLYNIIYMFITHKIFTPHRFQSPSLKIIWPSRVRDFYVFCVLCKPLTQNLCGPGISVECHDYYSLESDGYCFKLLTAVNVCGLYATT